MAEEKVETDGLMAQHNNNFSSISLTALPTVQQFRRGIWTISFEEQSRTWNLLYDDIQRTYRDFLDTGPSAYRLLAEIFSLAPISSITLLLCTSWLGVSSSISLGFLSYLLNLFERSFSSGTVTQKDYEMIAVVWCSFTVLDLIMARLQIEAHSVLRARLRSHFLPKLVNASLRVDLLTLQDNTSQFPSPGNFEYEVPGSFFLERLLHKFRTALTLISQIVVILRAVSCKHSPEKEIIMLLCVFHPIIRCLTPSNGIGCAGYVFWTENPFYKRLGVLYDLAFLPQCRADLILDDFSKTVNSEYERSTKALGYVKDLPPEPWRNGMLQPWYWDFLTSITIDLPLVAYVLTLPSHITPSALTSIALLHQATKALSLSVGELGIDCTSLNQVFARAKWLYDGLEQNGGMLNGTANYPCAVKTSTKGMRISFRGVTLKYPDSPKDAVHDVSFDIIPGSLVVVVGVNGSGKSSMLKLLARLFDPSSGEILIDDEPLASYNVEQVRATITFLSQSPLIYPLSVKDNICYGLGSDAVLTKAQLDTAARLGGSFDWIHKLQDGYDSVVDPWASIGNGIDGGTYGPVSERLKQELKLHTTQRVTISGGEKQRLAASRTFMKMINSQADSRLVVLDEATSSLDPIAERDLLSAFLSLREGKTMIFVTHRFEHLVKGADQILCMNDGAIVGSGTHTTLMKNCEEYAGLYNARVSQ